LRSVFYLVWQNSGGAKKKIEIKNEIYKNSILSTKAPQILNNKISWQAHNLCYIVESDLRSVFNLVGQNSGGTKIKKIEKKD